MVAFQAHLGVPAEWHMTLDYYNRNAEAFGQRTRDCPVRHLQDAFMSLLHPGAHILDAGCGSGRDTLVFLEHAFQVTAMDASSAMVELATKATGQSVLLSTFADINFEQAFDGIWANASLLHVPAQEIDDVLNRLSRALKVAGVLYMSVKVGDGERIAPDQRLFCDYSEASLRATLSRHPELLILDIHQSPANSGQIDPRPWVHTMLRKAGV
jgi:ubiquinone/menaquinone biosynthesis C-methylase UbiE